MHFEQISKIFHFVCYSVPGDAWNEFLYLWFCCKADHDAFKLCFKDVTYKVVDNLIHAV